MELVLCALCPKPRFDVLLAKTPVLPYAKRRDPVRGPPAKVSIDPGSRNVQQTGHLANSEQLIWPLVLSGHELRLVVQIICGGSVHRYW